MRKPLAAANWKMNKVPAEAVEFITEFLPHALPLHRIDIVICPPAPLLPACCKSLAESQVRLGAQNMHWAEDGAYTGEISAKMLQAVGCTHVIIGHSERRQYFCETDETVNLKLRAALRFGLTPIVCVGELLEERDAGITDDVLRRQCSEAFREISAEEARPLVIAYEPVWAIGTGRTATAPVANEAHLTIREELKTAFGEEIASGARILYGGSVKHENIAELMAQPEIDGALVGGASLYPASFTGIAREIHFAAI